MSGEAKERKMEMTPDQQAKMQKEYQKRRAVELVQYKKQLREGNELKTMQVEELELNIRYYAAKRKWLDLREDVQKLDEEEKAVIAEEQAQRAEMKRLHDEAEAKRAETKKVKEKKTPEIIVPEQGKAREK